MRQRPIHILVTGFGPFPHVPVNPSESIARAIAAQKRFARIGLRVSAHVFPTRWSIFGGELERVLAQTKADAVLHLGVAARRKAISVELVARAGTRRLLPDASGRQQGGTTGQHISAHAFRIAAPAMRIKTAIAEGGAKAALSNNAGRYLCNSLYAQSLNLRERKNERRPTLFLHIPMPAKKGGTQPKARTKHKRLPVDAMARAIAAAVPILAVEVRKSRIVRP